jgi:hypothetical protein
VWVLAERAPVDAATEQWRAALETGGAAPCDLPQAVP